MFGELALGLWTGAGLAWWIVAWRVVSAEAKSKPVPVSGVAPRSLTIFKPLPPLGACGLEEIAAGLESFVAQLDPESELLLGIREPDRAAMTPFLETLRAKYPKAQVRPVYRSEPDTVANPKIAWQMALAPHAQGELWFWTDADIIAPPGFLQCARREFAECGAPMLTFPYVVRRRMGPAALFETLFVNADFYPGVLVLRARGRVDFGLGAGMLFEREEFLKRVDWPELGAYLADDFQLGQRLQPVQISTMTLETVAPGRTWPDALQHDLRWAKTIRWNRPGGYFARLVVLPIAGWLVAAAMHPLHIFAWLGLLGMIQADVLAAGLICRKIGCRIRRNDWWIMEFWSLWRIAVWILSWLPGPVTWSERRWSGPKAEPPATAGTP